MNTLDLIELLETYDQDAPLVVREVSRQGETIREYTPGKVVSYRGYYDHGAVTPAKKRTTVGAYLKRLRGELGKALHGYKGGVYTFVDYKSLFFATDSGDCSRVKAVFVRRDGDKVVIVTAYVEDAW